jgi:ABC-type transport system involved in cytochrome c biogenesis permease subunit
MPTILFAISLGISLCYLAISFFAGAFFYTGRRGFSIATDALIVVALPSHLAYLVALGITDQKVPLTSFFEALSVIAFFLTFLSSILHLGFKIKAAAVFSFPLVFVCQLLATVGSRVIFLDQGLFRSALFGAHTLSTLLGYAAFACSMIMGLMYLHLFRELKGRRLRRMYDRLPPLELLERMNDAALLAGFAFLTSGIVLGSILAVRVWGLLPVTDPKILLSALLWLIYVTGFLLRLVFRWSARKLSYFSVSGFAAMVTFMVAVRLLLPTLHRF